jgi:hypothetical protein
LTGATRGYRNHPQLIRFRAQPDPVCAISSYLMGLADEAERRDYHFDSSKILPGKAVSRLEETDGQLHYEWQHLLHKLATRSPATHAQHCDIRVVDAHPLFVIVPGAVRDWEKAVSGDTRAP